MQEFFEEATYSFQEVIPFFGFDNLDTSTDVTSFYLLHYGKCFTITPKNETTDWDSDGYFLYLLHSESVKTVNDKGVSLSGFHIYMHDRRDVFTGYQHSLNSPFLKIKFFMFSVFAGNEEKVDGFLDYLYGEIYEDIKLNLKVQVYQQLSTKDAYCNDSYAYTLSRVIADIF
ncbi:ion channel [Oryctes borbonicus]|uniref:Ion channel n=1 Tax=Oryctes borbonicus TaxID=1629725 RepID=A0A0T6BCL0_9SCAR|nr:ion channel [Oryctes borbonicus]